MLNALIVLVPESSCVIPVQILLWAFTEPRQPDIRSMSYAESWPLKLNCRDLAIGADPVGPFIRSQIGSYGLAMVASYAPASLYPALTPAEKAHVTKAIRGSVLDHVRHWLRPYVDRPQHARLMSRRAFHEAVERILASTESAPDVDAIYALLGFREFDTSWFGMRHIERWRL